MKKTKNHKYLMKDKGMMPFWWRVYSENGHFVEFVNWFTGERRLIRK